MAIGRRAWALGEVDDGHVQPPLCSSRGKFQRDKSSATTNSRPLPRLSWGQNASASSTVGRYLISSSFGTGELDTSSLGAYR